MDNNKQKGLLPRLCQLSGCPYLSDLHNDYYAGDVLDALKVVNISIYPSDQWRDAYKYITGRESPLGTEKEIAWRLIRYMQEKIDAR